MPQPIWQMPQMVFIIVLFKFVLSVILFPLIPRIDNSDYTSYPVQSIGRLKNFLGFSKVTFSISSLFNPSILIAIITLGIEK
ncbi:hypothetical protein ES703_29651 [subsurface metagenome]